MLPFGTNQSRNVQTRICAFFALISLFNPIYFYIFVLNKKYFTKHLHYSDIFVYLRFNFISHTLLI